jgi:hypothetical protein
MGHFKLTLHIAIVALVVIWIANNVGFVKNLTNS